MAKYKRYRDIVVETVIMKFFKDKIKGEEKIYYESRGL